MFSMLVPTVAIEQSGKLIGILSSTTGVNKTINSKQFPSLFVRSLWRGIETEGEEWEWGKLEMCDDTVCTDGLTNEYPTRILTFGVDDFGRIPWSTLISVP